VLLHWEEGNTGFFGQCTESYFVFIRKWPCDAFLVDLPFGIRTKETSLVDRPRRNIAQSRTDVDVGMFGNMRVIQSAIPDLVLVVNRRIDKVDGRSIFVPHPNFSLSLFALFDQVGNENRTRVPSEQISKVEPCGRIRCIHFVQFNRWFWHRETAFLRPVDGDRTCTSGDERKKVSTKKWLFSKTYRGLVDTTKSFQRSTRRVRFAHVPRRWPQSPELVVRECKLFEQLHESVVS
jgi:hypothetical protein